MSRLPDSTASQASADDALPPVQPPDAGFILQLFLIPMIIVAIIVVVWLMFSWLAHMGDDPQKLVRDLRALNADSWQKAYTLTNLLRNPEYAHLKDDSQLAAEIATLLDAELKSARYDAEHVRLRVFLCLALGEFRVPDGLPSLVQAVQTERQPVELDVRYAALQALAVLAQKNSLGPEALRARPDVLAAVSAAAAELGETDSDRVPRGELRATAAFALGTIGGEACTDQLVRLLDDSYANARYNAATGLTRSGDLRAQEVLLEMLDENNPRAIRDERSDSEQQLKRDVVLINGIRATLQLATQHPPVATRRLREQLAHLTTAEIPQSIRLLAREALQSMPASETGAQTRAEGEESGRNG